TGKRQFTRRGSRMVPLGSRHLPLQAMAQSAQSGDWYDEEDDALPSGAPKAGIIAAAVTNFIAGGLALIGGFFLAVQGVAGFQALADSPLSGKAIFTLAGPGKDILEKVDRVSSVIASPLALALMLFGLGAIVAGVGVA